MANISVAFDAVCYSLAALYLLICTHCIVQLCRLQRVSRVWTRQKITHALIIIMAVSRAAFFCGVTGWSTAFFYTTLVGGMNESWTVVLDELPSLIVITIFSMQLLMW
jgi:hypothetical protein